MRKDGLSDRINNGALRPMDMKSAKGKITYGILSLVMLLHLLIVCIPVLWMILLCFKEPAEIYSKTPTFFPESINLGKIADLWNQLEIYKYYLNTLIVAVGCVIFDVGISGLAGYSLSRLKPKGSRIYFVLVSVTMLLPATTAMVPNYMLYKDLGLLNSYIPLWLIAGMNMFHVLLFKSSFDGLPLSIIEAAKIDGASDIRIFLWIIIPMSIPVVATCAIFTFNAAFGDFFWPYLLITDPEKMVMGVRLFEIKGSNLSMDKQMVAALFTLLPQAIIFIVFQKYIMGGINIGGVKG